MPASASSRSRLGASLRAIAVAGFCCATLLPGSALAQTTAQRQTFTVAWGGNYYGTLGAGYKGRTYGPAATLVSNVREIASAGSNYALLENGTIDAWGANAFGQLGDGTHLAAWTPTPVSGITEAVAVAAGQEHAMALLANGTVETWGMNTFGTMGTGTSGHGKEIGDPSGLPIQVPGLSGVVAIASGGGEDAALLSDGTVETWGANKAGQLGDGTTVEKTTPTPALGLTHVKAIAVGGGGWNGHTLALLQNGTVMAAGNNMIGELGTGDTVRATTFVPVPGLSHVVAISADMTHSMALLENGTVMTWGSDGNDELGIPAAPEQCFGTPCSTRPVPVSGLSDVSAISAGYRFSLALSDGKVYAWGWNTGGEMGSRSGREGRDQLLPIQVPLSGEAKAISAGWFSSLALTSEPGPPPPIEITPGRGSLTVRWVESRETTVPWTVRWRPAGGSQNSWPRAQTVELAPAARSYTITGLSAEPYEVLIKNQAGQGSFRRKTIVGTPLAPQ
ncbi:MAG TPA: hypothetical protein VMF09_13845 [Solirubrobacteraceae bacterium]|nr:hypothetical protein [Solirubrobacteraceae bacterium]